MMHKIKNENVPKYLTQMFEKQFGSSNYYLRSSDKNVEIPNVRTDCYKRSFAVSGAVLWNSLPDSLKEIKNLSNFKQKMKSTMFCTDDLYDFLHNCK